MFIEEMTQESKIDHLYRRMIFTKFFLRGWGKREDTQELLRLRNLLTSRTTARALVSKHHPITIERTEKTEQYTVLEGYFTTPLYDHAPKLVPCPIRTARFQMVVPSKKTIDENQEFSNFFTSQNKRPAVILVAGTGDHGYHNRCELMAKPLLAYGITTIILENPFYGPRKPVEQFSSGLLHVNDLFIMGCCVSLECSALLHWLKKKGYGPLGLSGISLGGHMVSLAATIWPERLALIPCLSYTTGSIVWTKGVLANVVRWAELEDHFKKEPWIEQDILKQLERTSRWAVMEKSDQPNKMRAFMTSLMDHYTHLGNYEKPYDVSTCTFVVAKYDAYVPMENAIPISKIWKGCEVREISCGHVFGFLYSHNLFNVAIADTLKRMVVKDATEYRGFTLLKVLRKVFRGKPL